MFELYPGTRAIRNGYTVHASALQRSPIMKPRGGSVYNTAIPGWDSGTPDIFIKN